MRTQLLIAALCVGTAAAGKPLYMTVSRTYATHEAPTIEVAFQAQGPVELRVLRPTSLEAFVSAQSDLRRAYVEPPSMKNPGRGLSRGLSAMKAPGDYLLLATSKELRAALAEAVPPRPQRRLRALPGFAEGPERIVGLPPGMELVVSRWLNLDLGGQDREFDVPGFGVWSRSGFQERRVTLDPLPAGLYVVQVVQDRIEGQVVLVVTDLAVQVKQTDGKLLARVAGRDQQPRKGAQIQVWHANGQKAVAGTTDAKGEVLLRNADPKVLVTARLGKDAALVDTDFYSTLAVSPDVFVYSDRPVYKPGDEAHFRGLVRKPDGVIARLFSTRQREVEVELVSQEGRRIGTTAEVDEFGAFHGTLKVPADIGAGVLRIAANVDDQIHRGEARAQDYVKPTFYLELTPESEAIQPGGTLRARVRARRFAGGVPAGARFEVFLYRSLLDTPAWVDDAGMGAQGSAVTYGSASTTEGKLSVPERLYSSVEKRLGKEGVDPQKPWASAAAFDANGEAQLEVAVPALKEGDDKLPWRYSLSVRARDDQNTFAGASTGLFLSPVELLGLARFSAAVARPGGELSVSVRATTLGGKAYGATSGSLQLLLRKADGSEQTLEQVAVRTGADGVFRARVPTGQAGTVIARATLVDKKGASWSGEAEALVLGKEGEPVVRVPALTLQALSGALEPGDTAELVALLPDAWSRERRGAVWVTLSGTALFSTQLVQARGTTLVHRFPIEKRFGSAVYASVAYAGADGRFSEKSVGFRIVPAERTLRVQLEPLKAEAQPLTEQSVSLRVTDGRGRPVVAQVSVGVVDKAVYAIQSEFRPKVLDFFYPLVRDNVATFTSGDFQGYGYGERLARALRLAPRHAFAAVKPPTRQADDKERDTAFWDAAVVTGADGRATVSFTLPSNQTLWTVTAVAADAAGRFGEQTAEFATRGKLNVYAAVPQFLRDGDRAQGSVRVSSPRGEFRGEVAVAGSGALDGFRRTDPLAVAAAGGEATVPFEVTAAKAGTARVEISLTGAGEPLRDARLLPVRPAAIAETLEVARDGGGELRLQLPAGAALESAELELRASTVAAALASIRDLLVYPYGCLEQLIATSVPNVAVAAVLQRLGAIEQLDPEAQALLAEARSRAVQGISRVLQMASRGGGFSWYGDTDHPSLPMTLIALDGLSYAVEAGLVERTDPRLAESARWLEAQADLPFELDAARAFVLARIDGAQQAAAVRAVLDRAAPAGDLYPLALAALAAEAAGISREPGLGDRVQQIARQSRQGFEQRAAFEPGDAFWRYPLRRVGRSAILAHAASLGAIDADNVRRALVSLLSEPGLSTFDRATALLHSLWIIEREAKDLKTLQPPAVQGLQVALQPLGFGLRAPLPAGATAVTVGSFEGTAVLRARVCTPLQSMAPRSEGGLGIERSWSVLREGGRVPLRPGDKVGPGEDVYVELKLSGTAGRSGRSAYLVVEDFVPAGFLPLQEDKAFRGAPHALPLAPEALKRRIFSPEKVTFFLEQPVPWSPPPPSVGYVLRAQFPGRYQAPPATVEDMYAAQSRGRTAGAVLEIAAGR